MISTTAAVTIYETMLKVRTAATEMLTDTADGPNTEHAAKALEALWSGAMEAAEALSKQTHRARIAEAIGRYATSTGTRNVESLIDETDRLVRRVLAVYRTDFEAPAR